VFYARKQYFIRDPSFYSVDPTRKIRPLIDRKFMKVRFENIDRQTPVNLAMQVRTLPDEFDDLYFQNAHPDLHPVYSGRQDPTEASLLPCP
jgi:hypothetical protein